MKNILLAITAAISLCSCAGIRVTQTQVATGAMSPKKIFVRPFTVGEFRGAHGGEGMKTILHSQAGGEFAEILKGELSKLAPTTVLADDETADGGWLVEGELQVVDAGCPMARTLFGRFGIGRSGVLIHVRITDADRKANSDGKGGAGNTLYEFDRWRPLIGKTLPLSEAVAAHQLQEDNTVNKRGTLRGKIVLLPD